jgi:cyclase
VAELAGETIKRRVQGWGASCQHHRLVAKQAGGLRYYPGRRGLASKAPSWQHGAVMSQTQDQSREIRMNQFMKAMAALMFCFLALGIGFCQQPSVITAEKITDTIYRVKGGVANAGFVIGEKEVLAIDAEMTADSARQMINEIKKVTPKPLTKLVLTHSDGDHVNGIGGFPPGLEIISSAVAKKEMAEAFKAPDMEALQSRLPAQTFTDRMEIQLAPVQIQLLHFGPAHTSGDAVVFFPAEKLAFVGDLVFVGRDPLIHRRKGGSCSGLIKTLKALLELNADRYVPGHGDVIAKSDIETVMKSLQEKQAKVRILIEEGKSLDETKKAFSVVDRPGKAGGMRFPSLVEVIYLELSGKR